MKSYRKELWFETRQCRELANITRTVEGVSSMGGSRTLTSCH